MIDAQIIPGDREQRRVEREALLSGLGQFQSASIRRSILQVTVTLIGYLATVTAMYACLPISIWLTLALAPLAAGFTVRLFIFQHDCGHGAYFAAPVANDLLGRLCSLATFTPYASWRRQHAGHHATWNNLDRRDTGVDPYSTCMTLDEYRLLTPMRQRLHRLAQHPIIAHLVLPPLIFLLLYRLSFDTPKSWRRERRSVLFTNLALASLMGALILVFGWRAVLLVHLSIMVPASIAGVWLFSVQHRFEAGEWLRQEQWTAIRASLGGSSYLKLPRLLQWFTGNIGFHHIHHLLPRVPNYRLQACHDALQARDIKVKILTLGAALRAPRFVLWDEARQQMIQFPV
jgi:omega-6 fatty acid desaturase (delta-12 desaturase)